MNDKKTTREVIGEMDRDELIGVLQAVEKESPGLIFEVLRNKGYVVSGSDRSSHFRSSRPHRKPGYDRPDWLER